MDNTDDIPHVLADDVEGAREELGEDGLLVLGGLVKYPPKWWDEHATPDLLVAECNLPREHVFLHLKDAEWQSSGNPVAAVESIILRHRAGVFPSVKVMEWLAQGFEDWHSHQGKKSLEGCLGLKQPKKKQAGNQMKEAARQQATDHFMKLMLHLDCAFDLRVDDAASILAAWSEDPGCYTGTYKFPFSEGTLKTHRKKTKLAQEKWLTERLKKQYLDEDKKRELIKQFPRYTWEHLSELKAYL